MLPLGQPWSSDRKCWATLGIMGVCLYVFLWELCLPAELTTNFIRNWGMIPLRLFDSEFTASLNLDWPTAFTPFTYMVLHGGWIHLIGNMWMLWVFGREIEAQWGAKKMVALFSLSGFAAALFHVLINHDSEAPVIGASGAIAGVMGAYLVLNPYAKIRTLVPVFILPFVMEIPALIFMGAWCASQVFNGTLAVMTGPSFESVAWWAHIGGFLAGIWFARFSQNNRPPRRTRYYRESFAHYY